MLVVVALVVVGVNGSSFGQARVALIAGLLGVAGLALVVGPWVFRLASDLGAEREERIRTQERADVAAHLHDSVLQTLALIQKSSHDPTTVARLARAQERDLRSWLYAGESTDESSLAGALRAAAAEVEDAHGVSVDVVAVGDCDLDEPLRPIVQATREAVTNAAKHAGTGRVDVYAEVTDGARSTSSSATVVQASTSTTCPRTGTASAAASSTAWSATAAPPRSAPHPARAPRSGCTCPDRSS